MTVGILTLYIHLPGCTSLKEKRQRLKPLLARLHREYNISAAEMGHLDAWQEAVLACALVSNDAGYIQRSLQSIANWVKINWPDVSLMDDQMELIR